MVYPEQTIGVMPMHKLLRWGPGSLLKKHIAANYTLLTKKKIAVDMRFIVVYQSLLAFSCQTSSLKNQKIPGWIILTRGAGVPYCGFLSWAGKIMWSKAGRVAVERWGQWSATGPTDFCLPKVYHLSLDRGVFRPVLL